MQHPVHYRLNRVKSGTPVIFTEYKFIPERVSKRNGEKKPAVTRSYIREGTVKEDNGDFIIINFKGKLFKVAAEQVTFAAEWTMGLEAGRV
jgi:hypothetical protein